MHKLKNPAVGEIPAPISVKMPVHASEKSNNFFVKKSVKKTTKKSATEASHCGIVNIGHALDAGTFKVCLAGIAISGPSSTTPAIIAILDKDEVAIIKKFKVAENESYVFSYDGQNYKVKMGAIAPGRTGNAQWAEVTVSTTSEPVSGPSGFSVETIGGEIDMGAFKVRMTDVSVPIGSNSTSSAIIDIINTDPNVVQKIIGKCQIPENGKYVFLDKSGKKYKIEVNQTAVGDADGARWAELKVSPTNEPVSKQSGFSVASIDGEVAHLEGQTGMCSIKARLKDISVATGSNNAHHAILEISDTNSGALIVRCQIPENGKYVVRGNDGQNYEVAIGQTAAGYTLSAREGEWAEIKISPTSEPASGQSGFSVADIGGQIVKGNFRIRLADISVATGSNNTHPAIIDIIDDSSGAVINSLQISENGKQVFHNYGDGKNYAVEVRQTAAGYTLNAKWAEIKAYETNEPASEQSSHIINVGDTWGVYGARIRLADISIATGPNNAHPAIIDILDIDGVVVNRYQIPENGKCVFYNSSDGQNYSVEIFQTAPGYTLNAKWARIKLSQTNEPVTDTGKSSAKLSIGMPMGAPENLQIHLVDISTQDIGNSHPAIIDITNSLGENVDQAEVKPGTPYIFTQKDTGNKFTINVYQTAPGYTNNANWAEIGIEATTNIVEQTAGINLYPNPTSGKFKYEFEAKSTNPIDIAVFDVVGQLVLSKTFKPNNIGQNAMDGDLGNIKSGIYLFTATQDGERKTTRIVKVGL